MIILWIWGRVEKEREKSWGRWGEGVTQKFHCKSCISFCKGNTFWKDKDYLYNQEKKTDLKNCIYKVCILIFLFSKKR